MGAIARFLSTFILLSACGDEAAPRDGGPPGTGTVELGTGIAAFEEVPAEGDLALIAGPQGGHHFIVHARMSGLLPGDPTMPGLVDNPLTRFTVESESEERLDVDMVPYRLGYEAAGDGQFVLPGGRIAQVREDQVDSIIGSRVRIRVEVTDARESSATDERWVNAFRDPSPDGGVFQ